MCSLSSRWVKQTEANMANNYDLPDPVVEKVGNARLWVAPEKFEQPAKSPPPYPSCDNYDAKVWQFVSRHGSDGAVIWNVGR